MTVSKRVAIFTAYAGLRELFIAAAETTTKVELDDERMWSMQGILGVVYDLSHLTLGLEYDVGAVSTTPFTIGYGF